MSRIKKTNSRVINAAAARAAGMSTINPQLELGGDRITLVRYQSMIVEAQALQSNYNALLSHTDAARSAFILAEANLRDQSVRMLSGVAAYFGRESEEYQKAGGTKRSARAPYKRMKAAQEKAA